MPLVLALNTSLTYLFFSCVSLFLNKLYGYRKKGPGLTCISLHLPPLTSLPKQCRDCKLAPCEDKIQLIQFVAFFQSGFLLLCFGGFFFGRSRKFALFRDQHLGKQWIPVQKPTVKFCQTMKVFKGKIIQGKGQSLCYLPLCTDFLSVILNNSWISCQSFNN